MNENNENKNNIDELAYTYLAQMDDFLGKFAVYILFLAVLNYPNTTTLLILTAISVFIKNYSSYTQGRLEAFKNKTSK